MKRIVTYRKEVNKILLKNKTITIPNYLINKINSDIKEAQNARKNGDMGTPVEEVILKMKKIIEGEPL